MLNSQLVTDLDRSFEKMQRSFEVACKFQKMQQVYYEFTICYWSRQVSQKTHMANWFHKLHNKRTIVSCNSCTRHNDTFCYCLESNVCPFSPCNFSTKTYYFDFRHKIKINKQLSLTSPDCVTKAAWLCEAETWNTGEEEGKLIGLNDTHCVISEPWPRTPHKLEPQE